MSLSNKKLNKIFFIMKSKSKVSILGLLLIMSPSTFGFMDIPELPPNFDPTISNPIHLSPLQEAVQACVVEVDELISFYRQDLKLLKDPRQPLQPEETLKELLREYNNLAYYDVASKCWNRLDRRLKSKIKLSEFRAAVQKDFNSNK